MLNLKNCKKPIITKSIIISKELMNTEPNKAPINIIKTLVILFLSCSFSFAQGIPIQLMVVDGDGFEMPNKQVKLRLTLTNDTSLTTGQYQEVHSITTSDLGIASVELGSGITTSNSQTLDLGLFNFQEVEPFIKTELDTNLSPTQYIELGWMRYNYPLIAQRALKADTADYLRDNLIYKLNDAAAFNVSAGIAIPSIDSTAMNSVTSPVNGQMIYNTDFSGLLIYSSGAWMPISVGSGASNDVKRIRNAIILN